MKLLMNKSNIIKSSDFINTKEFGKGYWIILLFENFKDNFLKK